MLVLAIWSETLLLKPSARRELLPREEDLIKTVPGPGGDVVAEYRGIKLLSHCTAMYLPDFPDLIKLSAQIHQSPLLI